jgi:hypothetical protein
MNHEILKELLHGDLTPPPPRLAIVPLAEIRRRALRRRRMTAGLSTVAVFALIAAVGTAYSQATNGGPAEFADDRCGGAAPSLAAPAQPLLGATPQPSNAASLSEITNSVHVLAESRFADFYAGVAMDTETDRVSVWRKPSAEFDRALKALPGHDKIDIYCAPHSLKGLLEVSETLSQDATYWETQGLPLYRFGPRVDGTCVEVFVTDPEHAAKELGRHYPGLPLCFAKSKGGAPMPL